MKAYDLKAGELVPGVIADKSQAGWLMAGYPVARATSTGGRWVYTLYQQPDNYPFVHALDTVSRTAICIGLPWEWATAGASGEIGRATLSLGGGDADGHERAHRQAGVRPGHAHLRGETSRDRSFVVTRLPAFSARTRRPVPREIKLQPRSAAFRLRPARASGTRA